MVRMPEIKRDHMVSRVVEKAIEWRDALSISHPTHPPGCRLSSHLQQTPLGVGCDSVRAKWAQQTHILTQGYRVKRGWGVWGRSWDGPQAPNWQLQGQCQPKNTPSKPVDIGGLYPQTTSIGENPLTGHHMH
jgi:hypothetical protein